MRLLTSIVLLAACRGGDEVAGQYTVGGASFVLRNNHRVERLPTVDARCKRDPVAIEACEDRQTWSRDGEKLTLDFAAIRDEMMCECDLDRVEATYRNGVLTVGGVAAIRAR